MFIGREKEIAELKEMYRSNNMEAALIYGRRKVGKTAIINESLKDYSGIVVHYECKRASVESNLEMTSELFCKQLSLPFIKFKTFNDLFYFVFSTSKTCEFLLIINDFRMMFRRANIFFSFQNTYYCLNSLIYYASSNLSIGTSYKTSMELPSSSNIST